MKKFFSFFLISLLLTACSSENTEKKQGILSGENDHYIIYLYDSAEPVLLDKKLLFDEKENPISEEDIFLGLPVEVSYQDGALLNAHADMEQWENIRPTGYPNGFVQRPCLYYHGSIYYSSYGNTVDTLPAGFQEVFIIQSNSGCDLPAKEGEACHVDRGTRVYALESLPKCVYIDFGQGYRQFEME